MSPVDFKKWPCHPVEVMGQGPHNCGMEFVIWTLNMMERTNIRKK